MKYLIVSIISVIGLIYLTSVTQVPSDNSENNTENVATPITTGSTTSNKKEMFDQYWYGGLAELSGYDLQQSRYGEIHEGTATMIFVTEPFSKKKQVKLDDYKKAGKDSQSVLKLNSTRKFLTGIYPYSMMTSTFTPVNLTKYSNSVKISLTGQEWCGHVFQQLNLEGGKYKIKSYSYFESEGDDNYSFEKTYLEDEIFNMIRINPKLLPTGNISMVPSAVASRFLHQDFKPYPANVSNTRIVKEDIALNVYTIKYPKNKRTLSIYYQSEFPYIIESWEDSYKGLGGTVMTTIATRKSTKKLPYWSLHDNKDRPLNAELYQ